MRPSNFHVESGIYLTLEKRRFDLHNDYDFVGFSFDVSERQFSLRWKLGTGDWIRNGQPSALCLDIRGVYHLEVRPRDPDMPFSEDDCLESIGYVSEENWGQEEFWHDGPPEPSWRWVFSFQSGTAVVVGADEASVDLKEIA